MNKLVLNESLFETPEVMEVEKIEITKKPIIGSEEYDLTEGKKKRVAMYRKYAHLEEDADITEDNIDESALKRTCTLSNREYDQVRSEILECNKNV